MRAFLVAATLALVGFAAPAAASCHFCFFTVRDSCQGGNDDCAAMASSESRHRGGAGEMFRGDPQGARNAFHCYMHDEFGTPVPCDDAAWALEFE